MPADTQVLQNQPGTGGETFILPDRLGDLEVPEKLRGKTAAELLKTYIEGEKAFGQRADYDDLKRKSTEFEASVRQQQAALQAWEPYRPYLEKLGWDTRKLEQLATGQAGPAQTEVSMQAWASKWANAAPEEQLPFLLQSVIAPLYQSAMAEYTKNLTGQLQQVFQQQQGYQAQKEKLLFSMLKAVLPDTDIDGIYTAAMQKAEEMTKSGFDPFQAVLQGEVSKRQHAEDEKKLRQQIRAEVEQEFTAKSTPTLPRSQQIRGSQSERPLGREAKRAAAVKKALELAPHLAR